MDDFRTISAASSSPFILRGRLFVPKSIAHIEPMHLSPEPRRLWVETCVQVFFRLPVEIGGLVKYHNEALADLELDVVKEKKLSTTATEASHRGVSRSGTSAAKQPTIVAPAASVNTQHSTPPTTIIHPPTPTTTIHHSATHPATPPTAMSASTMDTPSESHLATIYGTGTPETSLHNLTTQAQDLLNNPRYPDSGGLSFFSLPPSSFLPHPDPTHNPLAAAFGPGGAFGPAGLDADEFFKEMGESGLEFVEDEWDIDGDGGVKMRLVMEPDVARRGRGVPYRLETVEKLMDGSNSFQSFTDALFGAFREQEDEGEEKLSPRAKGKQREALGEKVETRGRTDWEYENEQEVQYTYRQMVANVDKTVQARQKAPMAMMAGGDLRQVEVMMKEPIDAGVGLDLDLMMEEFPNSGVTDKQELEPELMMEEPNAGTANQQNVDRPVAEIWRDWHADFADRHAKEMADALGQDPGLDIDMDLDLDIAFQLHAPEPQTVVSNEEEMAEAGDSLHPLHQQLFEPQVAEAPVENTASAKKKPGPKRKSRGAAAETPAPRRQRVVKQKEAPVIETPAPRRQRAVKKEAPAVKEEPVQKATPKVAPKAVAKGKIPPCPKGLFEKFPDQILINIMAHLPTKGFVDMRLVNKTYKGHVERSEWWIKIKYIIAADSVALKDVVTSGILDFFSVQVLETFFGWQCVSCKNTANYIFLPMICRVCAYCVMHDPLFDIIIKSTSEAVYHFTAKMQRDTPQALVKPNGKSLFRHAVLSRVWVKDTAIARYGGSEEALKADIAQWDERKTQRYQELLAEFNSSKKATKETPKTKSNKKGAAKEGIPPRPPKLSKDYPATLDASTKRNACVAVKFISPINGNSVAGVECGICRPLLKEDTEEDIGRLYTQVYTKDTIKTHMSENHPRSRIAKESDADATSPASSG